MLLPAAAAAQFDPNPSVDQYVESVPSAGGGTPPSSSGGRPQRVAVPGSIRRDIRERGGSDARQLNRIVSSPELGAPDSAPATTGGATGGGDGAGGTDSQGQGSGRGDGRTGSGTGKGTTQPTGGEPSRPSAISAAVGAGSHGDGTAYGWLIAGIVAVSAAVAAVALSRRRRTYPTFR